METKHVYNSYNREEREGVLSLPYPQDLWIRYISSENGGMQPFFFFLLNLLPHHHIPLIEKS